MKEYYDMIFKRKSMRKFDKKLTISKEEMNIINEKIKKLSALQNDIKIELNIVKREQTTCKYGEYCLLLYSEQRENYLLNAGYLLEQLDLFLASINIGVCWYGFGRTKEVSNEGLDFVIMLAFGKSKENDFRDKNDIDNIMRKSCDEIWKGKFDNEIIDKVRLAPSAVNSQPWRVESEDKIINVFRTTKYKSIMIGSTKNYFNSIDLGIFLSFLEIILDRKGYKFTRKLYPEDTSKNSMKKIATYKII